MTQGQRDYWKLQEDIRHNKEVERYGWEDARSRQVQARAAAKQANVAAYRAETENWKVQKDVQAKGYEMALGVILPYLHGQVTKNYTESFKNVVSGVGSIIGFHG